MILRVPAVRTVLLAAAVSVAGDAAAMVALLLRVHDTGAGPWAVTVLLLAFALPVVVLMGPAGALADRADPRRVLATTALVLALQPAFALGAPSWSAVVPALVPDGSAGRSWPSSRRCAAWPHRP